MATNIPLTGVFKVTCEYKRKGSWACGYHTGIDLVGDDTIYSSCDGEVVLTGYDKSYGNFVVVKNNIDKNYHWFCHLSHISTTSGTKVTRTSILGKMGSTGNSTGKHLHFEIRDKTNKYGNCLNPAEYMGIPNSVGTYNTKDYGIDEKNENMPSKNSYKKLNCRTNIREEPGLNGIPHLYLPNTTVEIIEENVTTKDNYIWDKVRVLADNRIGYIARTDNRYIS